MTATANVETNEREGRGMQRSRITQLRQEPLAGAPFWLLLLGLWGLMEIAWRWRRVRAWIS
jgi:hypothetical protein